jgi:peptidoglycan/xylan/chitin deacetylase (PgdA/CDA1 family)
MKTSRLLWIWLFVCFGPALSVAPAQEAGKPQAFRNAVIRYGGLERGDTTRKHIFLTFTGGDFNDGGKWIYRVLKKEKVPAHFFFTGDFYRLPENRILIKKLIRQGHYLGPHSDKHLMYASWEDRDSLLVSKEEFTSDLLDNYTAMADFGITKQKAYFFMPPYEWYNRQISDWTAELGLLLINYSPGTRSHADYTTPEMGNRYIGSQDIYEGILTFESTSPNGLNGFILLIHIGTAPERSDKFYYYLEDLITELRKRDYQFRMLPEFYEHY